MRRLAVVLLLVLAGTARADPAPPPDGLAGLGAGLSGIGVLFPPASVPVPPLPGEPEPEDPDLVIPRVSASVRPGRVRSTAALRVKVSEPATLKLAVARLAPGRIDRARCVAATQRLRRRPGCTRARPVASASRSSDGEAQDLAFITGLRFAGRRLAAGRYQVTVTAIDTAGNKGLAVSAPFRVG